MAANFQLAVPDKPQQCAWYKPCVYSSWKDFDTAVSALGRPVLHQEKRCVICNKSVRRRVHPETLG